MTDEVLKDLEQKALITYCKEELIALKLPKEEIQELEDKGEIVSYYGHFLNYMALQPQATPKRKRKGTA